MIRFDKYLYCFNYIYKYQEDLSGIIRLGKDSIVLWGGLVLVTRTDWSNPFSFSFLWNLDENTGDVIPGKTFILNTTLPKSNDNKILNIYNFLKLDYKASYSIVWFKTKNSYENFIKRFKQLNRDEFQNLDLKYRFEKRIDQKGFLYSRKNIILDEIRSDNKD